MAVIYLRHDIHGTKVAFSEQEAHYDEGNGWRRFDINKPEQNETEQKAEPVNAMAKRGRKPKE